MNQHEVRVVTHFASLAPMDCADAPWRINASGQALQLRAEPRLGDARGTRRCCIAYGAAVEYARLGMRSLGYGAIVRLAPRANDPTLMATLTESNRLQASANEQRLIAAIIGAPALGATRGDLSAQLRAELRQRSADRGCWLRFLEPHDDVLARTVARLTAYGRPADNAPALNEAESVHVLVGTDSDDQLSWLRAGRAAADVIATLTAGGFIATPSAPIAELPVASAQLTRELGLIGFPQLIAHVARPAGWPGVEPGARKVPA